MLLSRAPRPELRPFLTALWVSDEEGRRGGAERELVLPTGTMHVVVRLAHPLRLYDGLDDRHGRTVGHAIVGGARASFYVRDVSQPMRSIGAQVRAGAAQLLLGVPAAELAGRHTPLDDLWGRGAGDLRERLLEAGDPARQLEIFESLLAARLPRVRGLHPAVAHALERFTTEASVRDVVRESGYCHRHFIALFRGAVGLTPKVYRRVLRFQDALAGVAARPAATAADVALAAGYSDQAHFTREFRDFAGLPPGEYRRLTPAWSHHVPLREIPFKTARPRGATVGPGSSRKERS